MEAAVAKGMAALESDEIDVSFDPAALATAWLPFTLGVAPGGPDAFALSREAAATAAAAASKGGKSSVAAGTSSGSSGGGGGGDFSGPGIDASGVFTAGQREALASAELRTLLQVLLHAPRQVQFACWWGGELVSCFCFTYTRGQQPGRHSFLRCSP